MTEEQKITNTIAKCYCAACQQYFVGTSIFDRHHKGKPTNRRCMTPDEMRASGLATEVKNVRLYREGVPYYESHDVWFSVAGREAVRKAFGHSTEDEEASEGEE